MEALPIDQTKAAGKILAAAILPPLLIYLAVLWVARAPAAPSKKVDSKPGDPGHEVD